MRAWLFDRSGLYESRGDAAALTWSLWESHKQPHGDLIWVWPIPRLAPDPDRKCHPQSPLPVEIAVGEAGWPWWMLASSAAPLWSLLSRSLGVVDEKTASADEEGLHCSIVNSIGPVCSLLTKSLGVVDEETCVDDSDEDESSPVTRPSDDPISVDDSDGDESSPLTRPTDNRGHAGQPRRKSSAPQNLAEPRPKRRFGQKPNYIQFTNLDINSRYETLQKELAQVRSQVQEFSVHQQSFLEYIWGLGYDS